LNLTAMNARGFLSFAATNNSSTWIHVLCHMQIFSATCIQFLRIFYFTVDAQHFAKDIQPECEPAYCFRFVALGKYMLLLYTCISYYWLMF